MNKKVLSLGVMLSLVTTGAFAADVVTTSVNNLSLIHISL